MRLGSWRTLGSNRWFNRIVIVLLENYLEVQESCSLLYTFRPPPSLFSSLFLVLPPSSPPSLFSFFPLLLPPSSPFSLFSSLSFLLPPSSPPSLFSSLPFLLPPFSLSSFFSSLFLLLPPSSPPSLFLETKMSSSQMIESFKSTLLRWNRWLNR